MSAISEFCKKHNLEMTEKRFWELIESVQWAKVSQEGDEKGRIDYDKIEVDFRSRMTKQECIELRKIIKHCFNMLDDFINYAETGRNPAGGGDDSHSDLLHHIIGLGREEFYACLEDYDRMEKRGDAPYGSPEGYVESFLYVVPYEVEDEYEIEIQATIVKKFRVSAESLEYAEEKAHEMFTPIHDGNEKYEETVLSSKKIEKAEA